MANEWTVLGLGPSEINKRIGAAEKMFPINFTQTGKKFVLSLHYRGDESKLVVNGQDIYKFKAKTYRGGQSLRLGSISDFPKKEQKEVGLDGKVYEFSVDGRQSSDYDIKAIHTYLMKKHGIV